MPPKPKTREDVSRRMLLDVGSADMDTAVGACVRELLSLHLSVIITVDEEDGYHVHTLPQPGLPTASAIRADLLDALAQALGSRHSKTCAGCARKLSLWLYSHDGTQADGRSKRCLECDRTRAQGYYAKAKASRDVD